MKAKIASKPKNIHLCSSTFIKKVNCYAKERFSKNI